MIGGNWCWAASFIALCRLASLAINTVWSFEQIVNEQRHGEFSFNSLQAMKNMLGRFYYSGVFKTCLCSGGSMELCLVPASVPQLV